MIGSLAGALLGGSLLGLILGVLNPSATPAPPTAQVAAAPTTSTTEKPTSPVAVTPSRSTKSSPRPKAPRTSWQVEATPPSERIQEPWRERGLRLVKLEGIWPDDQGRIVLKTKPMIYLKDSTAKETGGQPVEYTVREDATIFGEFYLGDHMKVRQAQFSRDDLFNYARRALDHGRNPTFWLKRSLGVEGQVIYVAEQYLS